MIDQINDDNMCTDDTIITDLIKQAKDNEFEVELP